MNTLGTLFRITSFGESHGPGVGVVIDGCPPGFPVDLDELYKYLERRRPGRSDLTTSRNESDTVEILSGLFEGKTTGAPITILIKNRDARPSDYDKIKDIYRPSHADFTYQSKYGYRDHRGGGRSSARVTAGWVAAGALAAQILAEKGIQITSWVKQIYTISLPESADIPGRDAIDSSPVRCPDPETATRMEEAIREAKAQGDSLGGIITCAIENCPVGLGEPVFNKFHAQLGKALFSINAVKGVQFGSGFNSVLKKGSEHNDEFFATAEGAIRTKTNFSGGIQGGITNGMPVTFEVAFKPTATISMQQSTVDISGNTTDLEAKGRHDPCVVPRAVPIVEAMAALVTLDFLLIQKAYSL